MCFSENSWFIDVFHGVLHHFSNRRMATGTLLVHILFNHFLVDLLLKWSGSPHGQACFKVGDGSASSCTFKTDIELSVVGVLLMRNAEVRNYLTDG